MSMSDASRAPERRTVVLVVEDEPAICDLLVEALEEHGFAARCVQKDQQAFEVLRSGGAFACMIVDVNLGAGTTGYDVARFARTIQPGLPVIYVSGQSSEESFRQNGVTGSLFVPKPFTADDLMERVQMLVGDNDD